MKILIFGLLNILGIATSGDTYNCDNCLYRQLMDDSIDCNGECNTILNTVSDSMCPEVMCDEYCYYGHMVDENGCDLCACNNEIPLQITGEDCNLEQPSCDGYVYVCPKITEITNCNENGIEGYTTFRLSLIIKPEVDVKNIYAIYGNDIGYPLHIPAAYQSPFTYGSNLGGVNPFLFQNYPMTQYDSWLTIGIDNGDLNNKLSSVGIDFNRWTEVNDLVVTNGAIFIMNPEEILINGNEYLLGQITVRRNTNPTVVINVQGERVENERPWTENGIIFNLISPENIQYDRIPRECVIWYDGCNTCVVNNGNIGVCTRMMCFNEDNPRCLRYSNNGH